jgi:hypothetical protein
LVSDRVPATHPLIEQNSYASLLQDRRLARDLVLEVARLRALLEKHGIKHNEETE